MKNYPVLKYKLLAIAFAISFDVSAQLNVISNSSPVDLANKLVGTGVIITNATINCPPGASGTFFTGPSVDELGIKDGILLTTGLVTNAAHPNDSPFTGTVNGTPGNLDLDQLLPPPPPAVQTHDACMLEFDIRAIGNQVSFEYVFASEEYEEYYCGQFNDIFGFLVTGPNPTGGAAYNNLNIALIPSTSKAVSINTVGPPTCGANAILPHSPGSPGTGDPAFYQSLAAATTVQYDGKTVVLTAKVALKACELYHFKLGIEDVSDADLDSGVFIKGNSFNSPPPITCAASKSVNNDPGLCSAKVTFPPPTTVSACPITTVCVPASGSTFPVGINIVTCTGTDPLGNKGTCTFTITVNDNEKPTITCPANVTIAANANCKGTVGAYSPISVSDNCNASPTVTQSPVSSTPLSGHNDSKTVTLTGNDGNGNANSCGFTVTLKDVTPPSITCPSNLTIAANASCKGVVGSYAPISVSDNCNPSPTVTQSPVASTPLSGHNDSKTVTLTANDGNGNANGCTLTVTLKDVTLPTITCPGNVTISCETSTLPSAVGIPATADNCSVLPSTSVDATVPGSCPNEFTINRTWTVKDVAGNANTCLHIIKVEDKKPPVITCPANITVTCDTTVAKTGMATATDNCDLSVSISRRDLHISGDCEWFCITNREWTAKDDCRNTSKCVQVITKDVTRLIEEQALSSGALQWGQTPSTVTLPPGKWNCVVKWLPYSGTVPMALKFDDAVAGTNCTLMSNPLDGSGHIVNPLLGEAMKLKILVRLNPTLGTRSVQKILADNGCPPMHFIVKQGLGGPDPDVNELLRVTDLTLGNINVSLLVPANCLELLKVLKCVNAGRSVCNNP